MTKPRGHKLIIDFSRGTVKVAQVEVAGQRVIFHNVALIPMPVGPSGDNPLNNSEIAERIKKEVVAHGWTGMDAVCLLSRASTSTQSFAFPPMSKADLKQAVALKLRETLHFDLADADFGFCSVGETESGGQTEILTTVVAAQSDAVRKAVSILDEAGLQPVAISSSAEVLANLVYRLNLCDDGEAAIHVDIGSASTILNLLEGRVLRFSREFDVAGEAFTRALMRPIITVNGPVMLDHEQAEQIKILAGYPLEDEEMALPHNIEPADIMPLLEQVAQKMFAEIHRSVEYLRGILHRDHVDRIILSGPASRMRNLGLLVEEHLGIPVSQVDPVAKAIDDGVLILNNAGEGIPLSGFSAILGYQLGREKPINLLPREERASQRLTRLTRIRNVVAVPLTLAAVGCALLAIPVAGTYDSAVKHLREEAVQLDKSLFIRNALAKQSTAAEIELQQLIAARGSVPLWGGILKELSNLLPEHVRISTLSADRDKSEVRLNFSGQVMPVDDGFEQVMSEVTEWLENSPFFDKVHLLNAHSGEDGHAGRFEIEMHAVATPTEIENATKRIS